ncbi:MAG TPA: VTT domain-containing protein [Blastocatellia bacterium]|nr:VTT domain-containing protein [Blastocatellia bacterium]
MGSAFLIRAVIKLKTAPLFLMEWPWLSNVWSQTIHALSIGFDKLQTWGAPGIFIIAIFDSSLLSIPEVNDFLVVGACIAHNDAVYYYPLVAAAGSVIGCLALFHIARRGGQALLRNRFSKKNTDRVEALFAKYGALSLIIPSLCPPPTPFKIFVTTAGALQYPRRRFVVAILFGRFTRYTVEGILAVLYGQQVLTYLREYPLRVALIIVLVVLAAFVCYKVFSRMMIRREQHQGAMASGD